MAKNAGALTNRPAPQQAKHKHADDLHFDNFSLLADFATFTIFHNKFFANRSSVACFQQALKPTFNFPKLNRNKKAVQWLL